MRTALLALTALLVAAGPGCRPRPTEPIGRFQVGVSSESPGTNTKEISAGFKAHLKARLPVVLPEFRWNESVEEGPRWDFVARLALSESGRPMPTDGGLLPEDQVFRGGRLSVRLRQVGPTGGPGPRREYTAEAVVARNVGVFDGFDEVAKESVDLVLRQIAITRELESAAPVRVLEVLGDREPALRARAVEAIRERALWDLVPRLIEVLSRDDEDPDVVMKTIGALVASRDPRAVPVLIDSARRRSPIYLTQIIFGVAEIGGKEAEAYLFTVASGHADPAVKKNAQDALEELSRRKERESGRETSP